MTTSSFALVQNTRVHINHSVFFKFNNWASKLFFLFI